ncbi:hypothetical protein [Pseudomonas batumici]|uniref:hypothetical protein n=1 Tax=Pseudomonas batumici TaxID=226910 RepID=UPI0012ECD775|nr:hypothetical protein [Pseudomonas batumici]
MLRLLLGRILPSHLYFCLGGSFFFERQLSYFCVGANLYQVGICRVNFVFGGLLSFMVIEICLQIACCIFVKGALLKGVRQVGGLSWWAQDQNLRFLQRLMLRGFVERFQKGWWYTVEDARSKSAVSAGANIIKELY